MSATRTLDVVDIDVGRIVQQIGIYRNDPTHDRTDRSFAKAVLTPDGPGTMRLSWDVDGDVQARAWGDGARWLLDRADAWVGLRDDLTGFDPTVHPNVERWWRDHRRVRLPSNVERRRAEATLPALPGIGAWTATATVLASHGDPDVIVLRDYGMPTMVNDAFTGDSKRLDPDRGGDDVMAAHLDPWTGHRLRIVRLVLAAGIAVPRRAPKAYNPDVRRF